MIEAELPPTPNPSIRDRLTRYLETSPTPVFCAFAGLAAFSTYFAMYAYRKAFAAATFDHIPGWNFPLDYKSALVIAQTLGYALSKLIGVKVIAEFGARRRAAAIVGLIAVSWAALVAFALVPRPWGVAAMFINGLPLGLIWGLVFSYLEGRRTTEVVGAILCASFILSSGVVKSVAGGLLADFDMSPFWAPAATGALFFPVLLISVLGLTLLPPPSEADIAERSQRSPMGREERAAFIGRHWPALLPLVIAYVLLTALRDFRDNFAAEIWRAFGYRDIAALFTASELPVAAITLVAIGALVRIRNNRWALGMLHGLIALGAVLLGAATLAQSLGWIDPLTWMILSGAGLYMAYVPYNAVLFDRMIAFTRAPGNVGFLIYLADASGYVGSVGLLLIRNFTSLHPDWLSFMRETAYLTAAVCVVCAMISAVHFLRFDVDRAGRGLAFQFGV
jgi:MFS family permease